MAEAMTVEMITREIRERIKLCHEGMENCRPNGINSPGFNQNLAARDELTDLLEWIEGDITGEKSWRCGQSREALLDPVIWELLQPGNFGDTVKVSTSIIGRWVSAYMAGHVELPEMRGELIKALAKSTDDYFAELSRVLTFRPILAPAKPEGDQQ